MRWYILEIGDGCSPTWWNPELSSIAIKVNIYRYESGILYFIIQVYILFME